MRRVKPSPKLVDFACLQTLSIFRSFVQHFVSIRIGIASLSMLLSIRLHYYCGESIPPGSPELRRSELKYNQRAQTIHTSMIYDAEITNHIASAIDPFIGRRSIRTWQRLSPHLIFPVRADENRTTVEDRHLTPSRIPESVDKRKER